jgi:hypothetical protein
MWSYFFPIFVIMSEENLQNPATAIGVCAGSYDSVPHTDLVLCAVVAEECSRPRLCYCSGKRHLHHPEKEY